MFSINNNNKKKSDMKTKPDPGRWYCSEEGSDRGFVLYRRGDCATADPPYYRRHCTADCPWRDHLAAPARESVFIHGLLSADTMIAGLSTPTVGYPRTALGVQAEHLSV